jgi:cytidylate kinase
MKFIVAIDGPAGTGKSSVARFVAQKLNFVYVDTGAIYRALALLVAEAKINPDNSDEVLKLVNKINVEIDQDLHATVIKINNNLVDKKLRSENISRLSSVVSQHPQVRQELLRLQRDLAEKINNGAIFEGRDIGTVIFPKAALKIYITATSETRAKRRFLELKNHNDTASYKDILDSIEKRDTRDKSRSNSPMQAATDAIIIDTSLMTLEQVIAQTLELISNTKHKGQKPW